MWPRRAVWASLQPPPRKPGLPLCPVDTETRVGKVLDLLMDGLEELTLVFPNPGLVWLFHQPGVFVDEPRLPENVSSGVFHLRPEKEHFLAAAAAQLLSCVRLSVTPQTLARQAPLSMGFFRQEYWSGLPFPPPGDLPDPGIKPLSLTSPALAGGFFTISATWETPRDHYSEQVRRP